MKNILLIHTLVVALLVMTTESVAQYRVMPHNQVNPFLNKGRAVLASPQVFADSLSTGQTSFLGVKSPRNRTYLDLLAVNSELPSDHKQCLAEFSFFERRWFSVEELKGVDVLGLIPSTKEPGMFAAYEAGWYVVDKRNNRIIYKEDCLNPCIDARTLHDEPISYMKPDIHKKEEVPVVATPPPTEVNNNYYTTNTTNNTYVYEMEPFRRDDVVGVPTYIIEDEEPAPDLGSAVIFNNGGGRAGGVGINLAANILGGVLQPRGCQPVYQQQPVWRPQQTGPTWTGFVTPPGGEGYGGGTYTPVGPINQPTGGSENYPGGTWTGM